MTEHEVLAERIDAAVLAVDGVVRLYAAEPGVLRLARQLGAGTPAPATVVRGGEPPAVTVSVGIDDSAPAAEVGRAAGAVIRALAGDDATIHLRISRIHSDD